MAKSNPTNIGLRELAAVHLMAQQPRSQPFADAAKTAVAMADALVTELAQPVVQATAKVPRIDRHEITED